MIPDVRLQRAGRYISCVRHAVRFDLIGFTLDHLSGVFEVIDRIIETSKRDVAMAPVAKHSSIIRKFLYPFREDLDRLFVLARISRSPSVPDQLIRVVGIPGMSLTCNGEISLVGFRSRF